MKNLKLGLLSLLAILAVSVFLTSCEQEVIEQPLITDYEKAEQILENYIVEENGTFVLSESDPYKLGIDPTVFNELAKGLEELNKLIDKGEVKREWIGKTIDMETLEEVELEARGCNVNDISWGRFSVTVYRSTYLASWGCLGLPFWFSFACDILEPYVSANYCTCGYRSKMSYLGFIYWTSCQ